ncbi:TPA: hypothetical protein ACN359_000252 [Vibrio parahaemolyticus]|uniref:hypothetical protein n=1 Tax=Vibrio parahaemolyticus TaxID=670 RepID=UPI002152EDE4|nr:hypothetical protein [Vibrio parahaemolyticus]
MNKLTGALLIFTIFPAHVSANSCDIEGYTIGFFNGVATTLKGAKQGQKKIESTLGINLWGELLIHLPSRTWKSISLK